MGKKKSKASVVTPTPAQSTEITPLVIPPGRPSPAASVSSMKGGYFTCPIISVRVFGYVKVFNVHRDIFLGSKVLPAEAGDTGFQDEVIVRGLTVEAFELVCQFLYNKYIGNEAVLLHPDCHTHDVDHRLKMACESYCFALKYKVPRLNDSAMALIETLSTASIRSVTSAAVHVYANVATVEPAFDQFVSSRMQVALNDPKFLHEPYVTELFGKGTGMAIFKCLRGIIEMITLCDDADALTGNADSNSSGREPMAVLANDQPQNGPEDMENKEWAKVDQDDEIESISLAATSSLKLDTPDNSVTDELAANRPTSSDLSLHNNDSNNGNPSEAPRGTESTDESTTSIVTESEELPPTVNCIEEAAQCALRHLHLERPDLWLGCPTCTAEVQRAAMLLSHH